MEAKKKISRFEFAIMEIADPVKAENYEPFTEDEDIQMRTDNIKNQFEKLKVKTNE